MATKQQTKQEKAFFEIRDFAAVQFGKLIQHTLGKLSGRHDYADDETISPDAVIAAPKTVSDVTSWGPALTKSFMHRYRAFLEGSELPVENDPNALNLSLIEDDTLEESIMIGDLGGRIHEKYDPEIRAIKRGLVRLSRELKHQPEPDAILPQRILLLFQGLLEEHDVPHVDRRSIYKAFSEQAFSDLKTIYAGVLTSLQDNGYINEKENPSSPDFEMIYQFRIEQQKQQESSQQAATAAIPTVQASAQPPSFANQAPPGSYANIATPQALPAGMNIGSGHAGGGFIMPSNIVPLAAGQLQANAFQDSAFSRLLYDFLSGKHQGTSSVPDYDPNSPAIDTADLMGMLSNLQSSAPAGAEEIHDPEAIAARIKNDIKQFVNSQAKRLSTPESNVIELVNQIFIAILEDPDLSDPVKVQLSRLQIPYLKAALLDVTLLKQETHPARLLLNDMAQLGIGIEDHQDPIYQRLKATTEYIVQNFTDDLTIFTEQLNELRNISTQELQTVFAQENQTRTKAESQAKLLYIKKIVIQQIRKFLKGKELPSLLHSLVLKGFAPLFLHTQRRFGEDSDEWRASVDLFRQIIESAQPGKSQNQLSVIVDRKAAVIKKAKQALTKIQQARSDTNLLAGLENFYAEKEREYDTLKFSPQADQEYGLIDDKSDPFDYGDDVGDITLQDALPTQPDIETLLAQIPPELTPGTWCEVYMGRDKPHRRLKLSSVLKETTQLIFVDSIGSHAELKDIAEFLDELDCERSRIINEDNLFDKALAAVITNMQVMREV
ncbi:MAG: DUF1631 family protein [Gammaproteobacteria bacterium]|nr:DUF1631 family protein [Gammaproteobacteria bacterium]